MHWPQQPLLKPALGFSLKQSQFLSPAKQELILTGILCNSREPGDWEKQGWGETPQDEGRGGEEKQSHSEQPLEWGQAQYPPSPGQLTGDSFQG